MEKQTVKKQKVFLSLEQLYLSIFAIILSLLITALIMLVSGENPINAFQALLAGALGSKTAIATTLGKTVPLLFVGMACAFSNKAGLFNIGCEGQLYIGALTATATALAMQGLPRFLVILVSFLTGMMSGALVGGFNGLLKAKLNINEVLVAIMLNYIMKFFASYCVHGPMKDPKSKVMQSPSIGQEYMLTKILPKSQLTTALILGLILAALLYVFINKTGAGFALRAVGENGSAAQAAGISMVKTVIITMAASGAIAALTGVTEVFGKTGKFVDGFSPGYGFTGIAVAVLGNNHPVGVILSALLFGILESGAMTMSYVAGVSTSMIKVINIDQSPIGRTPRSNPATYTGVFDLIRDLFAGTPDAKARGYKKGRFSFNVKGGRCEACAGDGILKIEMHFLPDVYVPCEVCGGKRYNRETLEVRYKGKNIYDVLNMTVEEAVDFFENVPSIRRKMETLRDVGLSYIRLGQPSTELSGGEAQRIKLATELSKRSTGKTVYILDEPTTGLHFADVHKLTEILRRLSGDGNTVIVIEHNLDVIKTADYIIDIGPEGGDRGGTVVASGTPEEVAKNPDSYTGKYIASILEK